MPTIGTYSFSSPQDSPPPPDSPLLPSYQTFCRNIYLNNYSKQKKGTPKQFGSGGEIQVWKDVSFWLFYQFLCHMPQRNWIFFQYCLSQWVTATKNCFVCRTEPLRQTDFLFVALGHCDKQSLCMFRGENLKRAQKCYIFWYLLPFVGTFCNFLAFFMPFFGFFLKILHTLAICVQYISILFVAVTQCDKQKILLSQWLSATNKTNPCHSDSVQQTILKKSPIYWWHVTKELKKR